MPLPGPTHARVPARVGLVGNPSDGYGGAVLAASVDTWAAAATVTPIERGFRIRSITGAVEWSSPDGVTVAEDLEEQALATAAVVALRSQIGARLPPVEVAWSSTIPRSVGLAGSSAIAIAVIEATAASAGRRLDPRVTAAVALEAETVGLGVAAGWQDRMVQAHRCAVLVDAASSSTVDDRVVPVVRTLPGLDIEAIVGWRLSDAEDSGTYHGELRGRADEPAVEHGMRELAALARRAFRCAERADVEALAELVDLSWVIRTTCAPLHVAQADLVEAVRSTGTAATSPGSGGSVVALPTCRRTFEATLTALAAVGADAATVRLR